MFAIAGSSLVRDHPDILRLGAMLQRQGAQLHLYFANAQFRLAGNGTDLGFEGAEFEAKAEAEVRARLGSFLPEMKCAVWDWGDRFQHPEAHLEEIALYYKSVDAPQWILSGIQSRQLPGRFLSTLLPCFRPRLLTCQLRSSYYPFCIHRPNLLLPLPLPLPSLRTSRPTAPRSSTHILGHPLRHPF